MSRVRRDAPSPFTVGEMMISNSTHKVFDSNYVIIFPIISLAFRIYNHWNAILPNELSEEGTFLCSSSIESVKLYYFLFLYENINRKNDQHIGSWLQGRKLWSPGNPTRAKFYKLSIPFLNLKEELIPMEHAWEVIG